MEFKCPKCGEKVSKLGSGESDEFAALKAPSLRIELPDWGCKNGHRFYEHELQAMQPAE